MKDNTYIPILVIIMVSVVYIYEEPYYEVLYTADETTYFAQ